MLKTLFYIVLIYFAIRLIQKVFTVRKAVKDVRSRMEDYHRSQEYSEVRREGDMVIKKTAKKKGKKYEAGDYVDYEEIE